MTETDFDPAILLCIDRLIVPFEGFRPAPYQDMTGVWTIGYGTTRLPDGNPVGPDTPLVTDAEARAYIEHDLGFFLQQLDEMVTVPLTLNQTAALLDFEYNLGASALEGSTLLRLLNQADYAGAADQFVRWDHAGGQVVLGLLRRREAERTLFLT